MTQSHYAPREHTPPPGGRMVRPVPNLAPRVAMIDWMMVADVAKMLNCSKMTVYRLIHRGELQATRVGRGFRVKAHDVRNFIRTNSTLND